MTIFKELCFSKVLGVCTREKKTSFKHYWEIDNATCIYLPNARRMKKRIKFETIILAIIFRAQDKISTSFFDFDIFLGDYTYLNKIS